MDLLEKAALAIVLIVILLVAVYLVVPKIITQPMTEQQAVSMVLHDIQVSNPGANVSVTNVSPSQYKGSWHILLSVTFNSTSPCPSYYAWSFDYPKFGFVPRLENTYTQDCMVYGLIHNSSYIIGAAPVAIARSYNLSIPSIDSFVKRFGYGNVSVHATFYNSTLINSRNFTSVWVVDYAAPKANYSEVVVLSQVSGNLLYNYTIS